MENHEQIYSILTPLILPFRFSMKIWFCHIFPTSQLLANFWHHRLGHACSMGPINTNVHY